MSRKVTEYALGLGAVAEHLGVSTTTASRWAALGLIPFITTPAGIRRFHPDDITAIADRMLAGAAAPGVAP